VRVKATEMLVKLRLVVSQQPCIAQQVQKIHDSDRLKNRAAIKCLPHCTHFLAHQHISHACDFVDLVVSC